MPIYSNVEKVVGCVEQAHPVVKRQLFGSRHCACQSEALRSTFGIYVGAMGVEHLASINLVGAFYYANQSARKFKAFRPSFAVDSFYAPVCTKTIGSLIWTTR